MTAELALRTTGLIRSFNGRRVVDDVDLAVERGEIMGFLGPNGAGKTTVMNMVMGLLPPHAGEIELLGIRGGAARRDIRLRVGYLQEKPRIYPEMTVRRYLGLFARLYGVPAPDARVAKVLDRVGLADAADRPLGGFSRGMQQRACLGRVMLHEPELLILDEPTLGLDPTGVAEMRDIFREMRAAGVTLLFSSHQLAEMEKICDRVAFMKDGRLIAAGRPADLVPAFAAAGRLEVETHEPIAAALSAIRKLPIVRDARETGLNRAKIELEPATFEGRNARALLARELINLGLTVLLVGMDEPSLEDVFLALAHTPGTKKLGAQSWISATPEDVV